jgi:ribosomal-protein-alanine N-acetyltransferase
MKIEDIFGNLPVLETERMILRPITMDDAEDMYAYGSDPEVTRYVTWHAHQSIEETQQFISFLLGKYEEGAVSQWGIEHKESGRLIGTMGFINWNRGYTSEAMKAIIDFGWNQMKLVRIEARCMPDNINSARVMEKVGMQYEGLMRKNLYVKGRFHDAKIYAIVAD